MPNTKIIHLLPKEVRTMGRQAKGVRLIRLDSGRTLASIVAFEEASEDDGADDSDDTNTPNVSPKKAQIKADGEGDEDMIISFKSPSDELGESMHLDTEKEQSPVAFMSDDLFVDNEALVFDKEDGSNNQQTMLF